MRVLGFAFKTGIMYASIGFYIQNRDNVYEYWVLLSKTGESMRGMDFAYITM